jgi:hypothetical protein
MNISTAAARSRALQTFNEWTALPGVLHVTRREFVLNTPRVVADILAAWGLRQARNASAPVAVRFSGERERRLPAACCGSSDVAANADLREACKNPL